jgi:hypothetical protein
MLSDIDSLKEYAFNYVFLDESQNIKNPETQRYKAACQLQSRNRIAITGTPVENNTFDLYGSCPLPVRACWATSNISGMYMPHLSILSRTAEGPGIAAEDKALPPQANQRGSSTRTS